MDFLFSPWRYRYLSAPRPLPEACALCAKLAAGQDRENLVLYRGRWNAVLLNLYPYTSGHMLILPLAHVARLGEMDPAARGEMMELAAQAEAALEAEYRPQGLNLGMNLGEAAGAGIAGHLHLHALPRWYGDVNFITAIGETRVLPEDLPRSFERLAPYFPPG